MGNTQPTNKTGRKVTAQKLENAKKLGVLSLSEHSLDHIPAQVFEPDLAKKLRTLDLSKNNLTSLGKLEVLTEIKSLNVDNNSLPAGSLRPVSKLSKLQNLSVGGNRLGKPLLNKNPAGGGPPPKQPEALPEMPTSLKQLNLASNFFSSVPPTVLSRGLSKLVKLDLCFNQLATVPVEITHLENLEELRLDGNMIVSLPEAIGQLSKLKVLALENNQLTVTSTNFNDTTNPQPLPESLFTDTLLIDLNLHGNRMTNTQLNEFAGFQQFLDRRQKVKSKTMMNLSVCGLN